VTPKIDINPVWLHRRYINDHRSIRQIAVEFGCCMAAIAGALRRFGIPVRPTGGQTTHGFRVNNELTPTYRTWRSMINRCTNPNLAAYYRYGGRGITVCDRWLGVAGFIRFLVDMGEKPDGLSLDRIDGNAGYFPENCRWATPLQQARQNRKLTDAQVRAVLTDPRSHSAIARDYEVSRTLISIIKEGKHRPQTLDADEIGAR
jgi:hypothetical protein